MASLCVEIPEAVYLGIKIPKEEFANEIKKMVALELYRRGSLSLGKACELAGITRWEFFELNEKAQIPIQYDEEDWERDKKIVAEKVKR
jgi:predicted HTH domain antitoxin